MRSALLLHLHHLGDFERAVVEVRASAGELQCRLQVVGGNDRKSSQEACASLRYSVRTDQLAAAEWSARIDHGIAKACDPCLPSCHLLGASLRSPGFSAVAISNEVFPHDLPRFRFTIRPARSIPVG